MTHMQDIRRPTPRVPDPAPPAAEPVRALELIDMPPAVPEHRSAPVHLTWQADHRRSPQLRTRHYLVMGVLVAIAGVLAWWQSSWLILLVMVAAVAAWEVYERWGGQAEIKISDEGVHVNDTHLPHAELTSFDIYRMPDGHRELSLRTTRRTLPRLRIPLHEQDPEMVAIMLAAHLPRERHALPVIDALLRSPWKKQ